MTHSDQSYSDEYGPRCYCGHYASEHDRKPYEWEKGRHLKCSGAYATLAADADDTESVEVHCSCPQFMKADHQFEMR